MDMNRIHTQEELLFKREKILPQKSIELSSKHVKKKGDGHDQGEILPRVRLHSLQKCYLQMS